MKVIAIVLLLAASAWAVTPCVNPTHHHKLTVSKYQSYEVKPCDNPTHHHKLTVSASPSQTPFTHVKEASCICHGDGTVTVYNPYYSTLDPMYPPPVYSLNNIDGSQTVYNPYFKVPEIQYKVVK